MLVKICGITNKKDAQFCCDAGADILGFVFAKSPRQVTAAAAKRIIAELPKKVLKAGVFVNEKTAQILKIAAKCGLDMIQLHGGETPEECTSLMQAGYQVIKAFRVRDKKSLGNLAKYSRVDWILLDRFQEGQYGGTGKKFDWPLAKEAKKYRKKLILSGGLGLDNIDQAMETVQPRVIDASSRLESSPGKKDHQTVAEFMWKAKRKSREKSGQ